MELQIEDLKPEYFLTEDPSGLNFKRLYRLLKGQVWFPIAFVITAVLKLSHKIKGRATAVSASSREGEIVNSTDVPALAMAAFRGIEHQLPDYTTLVYTRRRSIGLRQEYSAVRLDRSGSILAIINWQQHVIIVPGGKMEDDIKSTETVAVDFVSFLTDGKAFTTGMMAPEHLGAVELFSGSFVELEVMSIKRPIEDALTRHQQRIEMKPVKSFEPETAAIAARTYGYSVRDYFIEKGLFRQVTDGELRSLVKKSKDHQAIMNAYRQAEDGHVVEEFVSVNPYGSIDSNSMKRSYETSKTLKLKCPNCKTHSEVLESESMLPTDCPSCNAVYIPAKVIEGSNQRFSLWMSVGMAVVGLGILVYLGMTGQLKEIMEEQNAKAKAKAEAKLDQ